MTGWVATFVGILALLALTVAMGRGAARSRFDYLAVAAVAVPLVWLMAPVTGDVSRYLPGGMFSDGLDGKDQIIVASAASALFVPLLLAAGIVGLVKWGRRRWLPKADDAPPKSS